MERYKVFKELGRGTFGVVYRAYDVVNDRDVAIKQISKSENTVNREVEILTSVKKNDNIVRVFDVFFAYSNSQLCQFIVFEFIPFTLRDFISRNFKNFKKKDYCRRSLSVFHKILRGVCHLHSLDIIHRDLKPENVLIDDCFEPNVVKICDFGSAKNVSESNGNPYVVTRYYRAPELVFGDPSYGKNVDMWSLGCILVEMFIGSPVFLCGSDVKLFFYQVSVMGIPNEDYIEYISKLSSIEPSGLYSAIEKYSSPHKYPRILEGIPENVLDLVTRMLEWEADKRINAENSLNHHCFQV